MRKRILALLLAFVMAVGLLPTAAWAADGDVCVIGNTGYTSLNAAVAAATAGDTIWMTTNDEAEQQITVDKNLTIELQGFALKKTALKITGSTTTVNINDRVGTGSINTGMHTGFHATEHSRCYATLYITDNASAIISGTTGTSTTTGTVISRCAEDDLEKAVFLGSGNLTINGGTFAGTKTSGCDALFVYTGTVTINDGYFNANCGLSYNTAPSDDNPLVIHKGTFDGGMWIERSGSINGQSISSGTQTVDAVTRLFLSGSAGSVVLAGSTSSLIKIGSGLFLSDTVTSQTLPDGTFVAVGSTDSANPEKIDKPESTKIILQPQILGGDGSTPITYEWKKDGTTIAESTSDSHTIPSYSTADDGAYTLTATQGENSITVYYQVGEAATPPAPAHSHPICGVLCSSATRPTEETHGEAVTFQPLTIDTDGKLLINGMAATASYDSYELPQGSYYLDGDVMLDKPLGIASSATVNLCLNGYKLSMKNGVQNSVILLKSSRTLNLCDCYLEGTTHPGQVYYHTYTSPVSNAQKTINGGLITGGNATSNGGGAIYFNGAGTLNMYGGTIAGNRSADKGGGVCVAYSGAFNMYGGSIRDNACVGNGGGVYVASTFTLSGRATIGESYGVGNSAAEGGGVYLASSGTFNMNGGSVCNNTATTNGGGVYYANGNFNVSGEVIINSNTVNNTANDLYLASGRTITVTNPIQYSYIHVTTQTAPTESSPVNITGSQNADYSSAFSSDDDRYVIQNNDLGTGYHQVRLVKPASGALKDWLTDNELTVKGVRVTADNAGNILPGDPANDGKVKLELVNGRATLTLDNANIVYEDSWPKIIDLTVYSDNDQYLDIKVVGTVNLVSKPTESWGQGDGISGGSMGGTGGKAHFRIEGGTLNIKNDSSRPGTGFYTSGTLTVAGANTVVNIDSGTDEEWSRPILGKTEDLLKLEDGLAVTDPANGEMVYNYTTKDWYLSDGNRGTAHKLTIQKPGAQPGHTHVWASTWTTDETHHWHNCTATGCTVTANADKDGYGEHTWNDGVVTKEPTATAEGVKTYTCTTCAATKTEAIPIPTFEISGKVTDNSNNGVKDVEVTLVQGGSKVEISGNPITTDENGNYSFTGVIPGSYNIVAKQPVDGKTKTMTILVSITDGNKTEQNLKMPSDNVNSVLEVKGKDDDDTSTNAAADVSKIVVGGLEEEAESNKETNKTVTVTMTVEGKEENDADQAAEIKNIAGTGRKLEYLEIKVQKTVRENNSEVGTTDDILTTQNLLTIIIPFDFTGKDKNSVAVYRYHGNSVDTLTSSANDSGEKIELGENSITLKVKNFSTYAIGYSEENTPSSGDNNNSGGSYSPTVYPINIPNAVPNGTLSVNPELASGGVTVTITAAPNEGYEIGTVKATDKNGKEIPLTNKGNGEYTFTMSAGEVVISASFVKRGGDCPKDETCPIWPYTDASVSAWYHDGVHYCIENGLMSGYGNNKFGPDGDTSRAMIATILWRVEGSPVMGNGKSGTFIDVPSDQWYTDAIEWAAAEGVVMGYGDGSFGPEDPITREQLAAMLYRYEQYKGGGFTGAWTFRLDYPDAGMVSSWAYEPICWTTMNGIIKGTGSGQLDPKGKATRAQAAAMIMRFCERN